jgi:hypothetical protein
MALEWPALRSEQGCIWPLLFIISLDSLFGYYWPKEKFYEFCVR